MPFCCPKLQEYAACSPWVLHPDFVTGMCVSTRFLLLPCATHLHVEKVRLRLRHLAQATSSPITPVNEVFLNKANLLCGRGAQLLVQHGRM